MYVDSSIPSNFNKIAEISDNYVVLVKENSLSSTSSYEAYIQYFSPSVMVVHLTDYVITKGNDFQSVYHYVNNGVYSYVDYETEIFTLDTMTLSDISSDYYDRPDLPIVLYGQFLLVFLFVWVLNQLSKFVHKGGVFGD